jgi:hypothetical protein
LRNDCGNFGRTNIKADDDRVFFFLCACHRKNL